MSKTKFHVGERRLLHFAGEEVDKTRQETSNKEQIDGKLFLASLRKEVAEKRTTAGRIPIAEYEKFVKAEVENANAMHRNDLGRYHQQTLLQTGQENLTQHFGRVRLSPNNGQPKRLIVLIGGNNEPLTQAWDRYSSYRGTMFMFDQMGTMNMENTDIIQLKTGEAIVPLLNTPPPEIHTNVAGAHIANILDDALAGSGIFAGRNYTNMRMFGFSYGAGACQQFLERLEKRSKNNERVPTVDRTVFLDGVEFGSTGTPLRTRSGLSRQHYHLHQANRPWTMPIGGAPLTSSGSDFEMEVKRLDDEQAQKKIGLDHRSLHDARYNMGTFDGVLAALTQG